jgi:hypothetical protein
MANINLMESRRTGIRREGKAGKIRNIQEKNKER